MSFRPPKDFPHHRYTTAGGRVYTGAVVHVDRRHISQAVRGPPTSVRFIQQRTPLTEKEKDILRRIGADAYRERRPVWKLAAVWIWVKRNETLPSDWNEIFIDRWQVDFGHNPPPPDITRLAEMVRIIMQDAEEDAAEQPGPDLGGDQISLSDLVRMVMDP